MNFPSTSLQFDPYIRFHLLIVPHQFDIDRFYSSQISMSEFHRYRISAFLNSLNRSFPNYCRAASSLYFSIRISFRIYLSNSFLTMFLIVVICNDSWFLLTKYFLRIFCFVLDIELVFTFSLYKKKYLFIYLLKLIF